MIATAFTWFIGTALGKRLPSWAWKIIIAALLVGAGMLVHHVQVVKHDNGVRAAQKVSDDKSWQAKLDAANAKMRQKDAELVQLSVQLRKANDEENRRIAADAGALLMRGPGRAACPRISAVTPSTSGAGNGRPSDAPVAPVPDTGGQQLIALPFDDTTAFGADHDYWRARALRWDAWYANLLKNWPHGK